jgi:hypothetical protein
MRVSENRVLRKIFGPKGGKYQEAGEKCVIKSFLIFNLHQLLLRLPNLGGCDRRTCIKLGRPTRWEDKIKIHLKEVR